MHFVDRSKAGQLLGKALEKFTGQDVVVYALPRGGVVTAIEIAQHLKAPLDLIIARKIGHPYQPEYAIAAIAENGDMIGNQDELAAVDQEWLEAEKQRQRAEAKRRGEMYLAGLPKIAGEGKIAIIVDDGIATGLTMQVGILELKRRNPLKIIVAVPVIPRSRAVQLQSMVDELVALEIPDDYDFLGAVGAYYTDFSQIEDEEVIAILRSYSKEK